MVIAERQKCDVVRKRNLRRDDNKVGERSKGTCQSLEMIGKEGLATSAAKGRGLIMAERECVAR